MAPDERVIPFELARLPQGTAVALVPVRDLGRGSRPPPGRRPSRAARRSTPPAREAERPPTPGGRRSATESRSGARATPPTGPGGDPAPAGTSSPSVARP